MPFDGIVAKAMADELNKRIGGGRIFKIYQPERYTLVFHIRSGSGNCRLLMNCNANSARIHLTDLDLENPETPPVFCMLLRKHLLGGTVTRVECLDFERIINLYVESSDELLDKSVKKLVVEIMGRHSNIILVNSNGVIIDAVKHIDQDINRVREIMPARPYIMPPSQDKTNPDALNAEEFIRSLNDEQIPISKVLLNRIKGFSPLLCSEICYRAGLDPGIPAYLLKSEQLSALTGVLKNIIDIINNGAYSPNVVIDHNQKKAVDFHVIKLTQYGACREYDTASEAIDSYFRYSAVKDLIRSKTSELIKIVRQNIERCEKKISIHAATIDENSNMETYRLYGELITANIHMLKKGMTRCRLLNYYEPEETYVNIELDESLTPQENAQRYFKKYSKAKSALAYASEQLKTAKRELEYLENVLFNLEEAGTPEEVEEIREELRNQGYLRKTDRKKTPVHKSSPLSFTSSDGYRIWVGRNNAQNDELTLKFANPDDLWLHVKNIPGSHVIARIPAEFTPEKTLLEAAALAAWFSKARNSSKVQVDYTRAKYVRKPSGAKPGMVVYVNYKTIIVDPKDPEILFGGTDSSG